MNCLYDCVIIRAEAVDDFICQCEIVSDNQIKKQLQNIAEKEVVAAD